MVFSPSTFLVERRCEGRSWGGGGDHSASAPFYDVRWTSLSAPVPSRRAPGARRYGIDYERRVADVMSAIYGSAWTASPVISYRWRGRRHLAIPDGILRVDGEVIVVEVKIRHTVSVWPQLMERYLPLVCLLEPRSNVRTVEVCRSYDPSVDIPHVVIDSLHRGASGLEVLKWKI